ncbi:hypothetical protein [Virgibacillus salexigens]|uniref:Uncharacterized protein n=2 Tax=Virgibacillus TaxID=84406 RepID=A0A024QCX6_9BACI|nr:MULTISPECIES: hypothetical protein [Virgibacillus]MYL42511.1 hypothetical protein [Virgibacillus massiliensis]CDQ40393.1 hypothetical protein BN990_02715 [Virgibacillus massiliensis]
MMFGWFKSETEKKRDDYYELYQRLQDAKSEHDKLVNEAEASYSSYISTVPNLSNFEIPSNDFDWKREELNSELLRYFDYEKNKRSAITQAASRAYQRYEYYKNLAIKEEQE